MHLKTVFKSFCFVLSGQYQYVSCLYLKTGCICMYLSVLTLSVCIQTIRKQVVSVCICLYWLYLYVSAQYHFVSYGSVFIACICIYLDLYVCINKHQLNIRAGPGEWAPGMYLYVFVFICMYIACIECICMHFTYHMYLYVSVHICM